MLFAFVEAKPPGQPVQPMQQWSPCHSSKYSGGQLGVEQLDVDALCIVWLSGGPSLGNRAAEELRGGEAPV